MKKLFGLSIAALLVIAMVGGGTWAYFSDTETSSGNTLLAGTLDLGLAITEGQNPTGSITDTFDTTNWAPGETKNGTIYVNNEGSIAMAELLIAFSYTVNDGTPTTVDGYNGTDDTDKLDKMIKATAVTFDGATVTALQGKTLEQLNALGTVDLGALAADTEKALAITWTFDAAATNGCQGDSVDLTITFTGNQNDTTP